MAKKIKKSLPWFLILAMILTVIGFGLNFSSKVQAVDKTSQVVVGNAAPSFTVSPVESPISTSTSPTNTTTTLTFQATGDDPNSESYYLAICKTNSVTPVNGSAPTCGGGNWCISTATTDETQASCTYSVQDADAESNDWWGFVCDGNATDAQCSSADQGDLQADSGSPFYVNHPPAFTVITLNPSANPGSTVTWTSTASDGDTVFTSDTVSLYVCDASGWTTSSDTCTGSVLCQATASSTNPACSYTIPTPTDDDASPYDAYVYIVDNHGLEVYGAEHSTNAQYTVNNVAPTVSSVKLNNEAAIDLTESVTTNIYVSSLLADNNGCADIVVATSSAYRTGIGYSSCTAQNDNNCYYNVATSTQEVCGGSSDSDIIVTSTIAFWYHADPTGAATPWASENWEASFNVRDDNSAWNKATSTAVVEMNDTLAMSLTEPTGNIDFGTLAAGNDTGTDDATTTINATGNVALDTDMSGDGLLKESTGVMIDIQNQEYSTTSAPYTSYGSGAALTTTTVEFELELSKTTASASTSTDDIFWGLGIPSGTEAGTYYGTTTIAAVKDELGW